MEETSKSAEFLGGKNSNEPKHSSFFILFQKQIKKRYLTNLTLRYSERCSCHFFQYSELKYLQLDQKMKRFANEAKIENTDSTWGST